MSRSPVRAGRHVAGLLAWSLLLSTSSLRAEDATQPVDAGGLSFEAPAAWKASKPSNAMRRSQLSVPPVKGDDEPAEMVVFAFPGGGGTAEANIKRWQGFFKDADGNPPKIETKTVKGKNVDVQRVETNGHYIAPISPGSPQRHDKPNFRLLGAIVQAGGHGYYLRMIGPEKTMVAARPGFDQLISSIKAEEP